MLKSGALKGASGALAAFLMAVSMSCSTSGPQGADTGFKSVGRGAPVSPDIPWEQWIDPATIEPFPPARIDGYPEQHWLVGPFEVPVPAPAATPSSSSAPPATARRPRGSSRLRWTSSRRRISTPTARSGATSAISAATARMRLEAQWRGQG